MTDLSSQAISLKSQHPDWGYIRIAKEIGWDKDKVRRAIEHAERKAASTIPRANTSVLRYDAAKQAVAEAKTFDEVREWENKAAAVKEYARRANDRAMELDAIEIRERARRRRGELLVSLKDMGLLVEGRHPKTVDAARPLKIVTLADLDTTKDESARDQKIAAIDGDSFERLIDRCRSYMEAHPEKHAMDVLRAKNGHVNGARSIMGDRQEPDDSLDYFPTPPWATRALMEHVMPCVDCDMAPAHDYTSWEPACGEGHIAEVLKEYFGSVYATDVYDYGYGAQQFDFLSPYIAVERDWIITNPPFGDKAIQFVHRALDLAQVGVAMFFRSQWAVEGVERYNQIFRDNPPTLCAFFTERVNLCKGEWNPYGTTATAYCWLVWVKGQSPKPTFWIPPGCRKSLTKPDDIARFSPQYLDADKVEIECDPETGEVGNESEAAA